MNLAEAYATLEVDANVSDDWVKENYRWLVKFYHPDNQTTADVEAFRRVVEAYRLVQKDREYEHGS